MVYYRKYRPQTLDDLDKEDIRARLSFLFSKKELPHAFLFTGPKGIGKTSTARIIAKIVNCTKRKTAEPCNTCGNCVAIANGSHLDVIEIDAASNRGIDEIRDLRDKIAFAPAMGGKKIFIIDEVHMLTKEAFNALLKTLEEPPAHAVFILATTEVHKLPDTIISRCTEIKFTKATTDEIARSLNRIVKGEKLFLTKAQILSVAKAADGSFRDAAKILEQADYSDGIVSLSPEKFLGSVIERNSKEAITFVESLENHGVDFLDFTKRVLDLLHNALLSNYGQEVDVSPELKKLSVSDLKILLKLFSSAYQEIKISYIEQLPLELAVIEWTEKKSRVTS
jgi:DNA polymerase-3 subunit gamma/tau